MEINSPFFLFRFKRYGVGTEEFRFRGNINFTGFFVENFDFTRWKVRYT